MCLKEPPRTFLDDIGTEPPHWRSQLHWPIRAPQLLAWSFRVHNLTPSRHTSHSSHQSRPTIKEPDSPPTSPASQNTLTDPSTPMAPRKNARDRFTTPATAIATKETPPAAPAKTSTSKGSRANWDDVLMNIYQHYMNETPQRTKLIDVFLFFLIVVGGLQFLYCVLAGNYVRRFFFLPLF